MWEIVPVIEVGAATHTGLVRSGNEDAALAAYPVFVVADGMGGHAAGEVASALVVGALADLPADPTLEDVVDQVLEANRRVREGGREPGQGGMGTTVTGVVALGDGSWALINVGDSRVLLSRGGELRQLTTDHSEVQELVDLGILAPDEAAVHPMRHVITRSLGAFDEVEVDNERLHLVPGDRLLVCSDGLTDEVAPDEIYWVLDTAQSPQEAADALVTAAQTHGGHDNVTVIVLDILVDASPAG